MTGRARQEPPTDKGLQTVLLGDERVGTVHLAELRLFDLACRIARNFREDDLAWPFVAREVEAEVVELLLGERHPLLDGHDRRGDLAKTRVGKSYDRDVLDLGVRADEVLDLHGVQVFAAGDDDVSVSSQPSC